MNILDLDKARAIKTTQQIDEVEIESSIAIISNCLESLDNFIHINQVDSLSSILKLYIERLENGEW